MFELFSAVFSFIWCGNCVPTPIVQHYTLACDNPKVVQKRVKRSWTWIHVCEKK